MARRVRDANLESREGRSKLKFDKSYHRPIERGLHLGSRASCSHLPASLMNTACASPVLLVALSRASCARARYTFARSRGGSLDKSGMEGFPLNRVAEATHNELVDKVGGPHPQQR